MNEKDKEELNIPIFGDINITEETTGEVAPSVQAEEVQTIDSAQQEIVEEMQEAVVESVEPAKEEVIEEMPNAKKIKNTPNNDTNGKKPKRKVNYLVIACLVVLLVPCLVLLYIIIGSHETKGEPVIGDRFDTALDPAISEADVTALQGALSSDQADKITVTLRSATLRVTIDTKDDLSQDQIQSLMNSIYEAVVGKFPVETYFTNKKVDDKTTKMYDLEVSAYNFIPETDDAKANQIHLSRTKNSAAETDVIDVLSSAKDSETSEGILNPDTSKIPGSEGTGENAEGE